MQQDQNELCFETRDLPASAPNLVEFRVNWELSTEFEKNLLACAPRLRNQETVYFFT